MGQPVLHWQVLAKKPDVLTKFCEQLFSWKIDADNAMGYRKVDTRSGEGISGGIWPSPQEMPPMVTLFVGVPDVAATVEKALSLGATIVIPRQQLPDGDEMAVIAGPEGLPIGLMKHI